MIILLSPSKTMNFTSKLVRPGQPSAFDAQAATIAAAINNLDHSEFQRLAKTSEKVTDQTLRKFNSFHDCVPRPALWAYTGMVYSGLDALSFSDSDISFAKKHLRVLSAVYGYVKPLDLIKEYRLEMQTKIPVDGWSNLYEFWGDKIAKALLSDNPDFIVNLASEEYFKTINQHLTQDIPVIMPKFLEDKNGQLKDVTVYTKYIRGTFANWLIKNRVNTALDLKGFNVGYDYSPDQSSENQPVFIKQPGWELKMGKIVHDKQHSPQ